MKQKEMQEVLICPGSKKGCVHFSLIPQVITFRLKLLYYLLGVSTLKMETEKSHGF